MLTPVPAMQFRPRSRSEAPYPGLRSFGREEADIFFGRDDHVDEMIGKLEAYRFVCVTGPSGCGKSSLARTGLMNALEAGFMPKAGPDWLFVDFTPGDRPMNRLFEALGDALADGLSLEGYEQLASELSQLFEGMVEQRSRNLNEALSIVPEAAGRPVLLLVDQFEELFRYGQLNPHGAAKFVQVLLQTAAATSNIYVAITIRTDELDRCVQYPGLTKALNDSQFVTPTLDRYQLKEAIEGPLALFQMRADPDFVVWLLNSVEDEIDKLPLMQHALKLMYAKKVAKAEEATGPDANVLSYRDYLATFGDPQAGGVGPGVSLGHAMSHRLDALYEKLPDRLKQPTQWLFCTLTAINTRKRDIRSPTRMGVLAEIINQPLEETKRIVERFAAHPGNYLRVREVGTHEREHIVDVSHECVLRHWLTLRDEWLREEEISVSHLETLASQAETDQHERNEHPWRRAILGTTLLNPSQRSFYTNWWKDRRPSLAWAERYLRRRAFDDEQPNEAERKKAAERYENTVRYIDANVKRHGLLVWLRALGFTFVVGFAIFLTREFWQGKFNEVNELKEDAERQLNVQIQENEEELGSVNQFYKQEVIPKLRTVPSEDIEDFSSNEVTNCSMRDSEFCTRLATVAASRLTVEQLYDALAIPICESQLVATTIGSLTQYGQAYCQAKLPPVGDRPMESSIAPRLKIAFDLGRQLANTQSTRSDARAVLRAVAQNQPNVPTVFRNLGFATLADPTVWPRHKFATAGSCSYRALELSCEDPFVSDELNYSGRQLVALLRSFGLDDTAVVALGTLARQLFKTASEIENHPLVEAEDKSPLEVENWRNGAEAAADAARALRYSRDCDAGASGGACELVDELYEQAALAWRKVIVRAEGFAEASYRMKRELSFGLGKAALYFSEDHRFREVAEEIFEAEALAGIVEEIIAWRQPLHPRYPAVLAMMRCLQGSFEEAAEAAELIPIKAPKKYQELRDEALACEEADDLATYFSKERLTK